MDNRSNQAYFQDWYLKHQSKADTIALIPGRYRDQNGNEGAFVQVITGTSAHYVDYPISAYESRQNGFGVRIGNNIFTEKGIRIDLEAPGLRCKGRVLYGALDPLESDIMGPFQYLPFMECRHGVVSMQHKLHGGLTINGKRVELTDGTGYIETDSGRSFPKRYLWVHANRFGAVPCSIMVSIADIPMAGGNFTDCICAIHYYGMDFRLATYHGVEIIRYDQTGLILKQGKHLLVIDLQAGAAHPLSAPQTGGMSRRIHETAACPARFRFYEDNRILFDLESAQTSFEYANGADMR